MASTRLARLTLALYPLAYRRRYGEEMVALIEDSASSPAVVFDLMRGAVRAHLRPEPALARQVGRDERLRLGVSSVLLCWVLFTLAGLAFYKTTEGSALEGGGGAPGLLGGLHLAIQILAGLGSAAVVLGAAPLILIALRQGARRPELRSLTRLACACVVAFSLASAALVLVAKANAGPPAGVAVLVFAAWSLVALGCGIGCAHAARRGLFAVTAPRRVLLLSGACATVVVAAMVGIALLTAAYLVDLTAAAPRLAGESNGPLGLVSVAASLAVLLAAMVAVSLPAALGVRRAWAR
jgi:hypothetical protein